MPAVKVTEIVRTKPWTPPGESEPKTIYYDVKVEGRHEIVNVGRKPNNPLSVGDVLAGTLDGPDERGNLKFRPTGGGGRGGGGKSIEERRSIAMQASQKVAVDVVKIAVDVGLWKPETPDAIAAAVSKVAGGMYVQVNQVST